ESEVVAHTLGRPDSKLRDVAIKLPGSAALHRQAQIANSEPIPIARLRTTICDLEYHRRFGEPPENTGWSSVPATGRHLLLLGFRNLNQISPGRAKSELAIEPECARLDGLVIVHAYLIGIY